MMKKRFLIYTILFLCSTFLLLSQDYLYPTLNPLIKIKKLETEHFEIYFPAGLKNTAIKAGSIAEKRYKELSKIFNWKTEGKIIISFYNNYNFPNGFATVSPYNWIGIIDFPAHAGSSISNYENWIDIVITHELAHIFHLDQGRKITKILRKIFGRAPFVITFPELSNTPAFIEGVAVYSESKRTGSGRLNSADYLSYLKNNAVFKNFPPYDRIYGGTNLFPGFESIYIYGSYLVDYVAEKYGWNKIVKSFEKSSKEPIIYSPAFGLKKETGKFTPLHYKDLKAFYQKEFKGLKVKSEEISDSGFWKYYLIEDGKGNFYYYRITPFQMPYIAKYSIKTKSEEKLLSFYAVGSLSLSPDKEKIYFSAINVFKKYYYLSDLYAFDLKNRKLEKISNGQSLFYPIEYDSEKLLAVKRNGEYSSIVIYDMKNRKIINDFLNFQQISYPAFNKKNETVYFSANNGKEWDIYSYNIDTKKLLRLTHDFNIERYLKFNNDKLYFVTVSKKDKKLMELNLKTAEIKTILQPSIDIKSFIFKKDDSVYFLSIYKDGIEILKNVLSKGNSKKLEFEEVEKDKEEKETNLDFHIKKANLFKFYKPNFWIPTYTKVDERYLLGGMTYASDPYFRNVFSGALYYNWNASKYPSGEFSLVHYLWYLPLSVYIKNIFSNNSYYGNYTRRELKIGTFFSYGDYYNNLFTSLYYTINSITGTDRGYKLAGLEFNINYDTSNTYPLSLGREDGIILSAGYRRNMKILGSNYNVSELFLDLRVYMKGMFRNQTIALNLAYYNSSGDIKIAHFVGGEESNFSYPSVSNPSVSLQRAYNQTAFVGDRIITVNFEIRNPLFVIERGFKFYSLFLSQIYTKMFVDFSRVEWKEESINISIVMICIIL